MKKNVWTKRLGILALCTGMSLSGCSKVTDYAKEMISSEEKEEIKEDFKRMNDSLAEQLKAYSDKLVGAETTEGNIEETKIDKDTLVDDTEENIEESIEEPVITKEKELTEGKELPEEKKLPEEKEFTEFDKIFQDSKKAFNKKGYIEASVEDRIEVCTPDGGDNVIISAYNAVKKDKTDSKIEINTKIDVYSADKLYTKQAESKYTKEYYIKNGNNWDIYLANRIGDAKYSNWTKRTLSDSDFNKAANGVYIVSPELEYRDLSDMTDVKINEVDDCYFINGKIVLKYPTDKDKTTMDVSLSINKETLLPERVGLSSKYDEELKLTAEDGESAIGKNYRSSYSYNSFEPEEIITPVEGDAAY